MSTYDSYIMSELRDSDRDDVDSLPSSIDSSDLDSEEESDAEREWNESLQQLELLLTMVVVPYVGKYFGRKCAYWSKFNLSTSTFGILNSKRKLLTGSYQAGRNTWNGCSRSR